MIIVTGSSGFIGSNLIRRLNTLGIEDIISVDYIDPSDRFDDLKIHSHVHPKFFIEGVERFIQGSDIVFHQGANTCTTDHSEKMINDNFDYSKKILDACIKRGVRFVYASSAAVYGLAGNGFSILRECESPLNIYGFSKLMLDDYVRSVLRLSRNSTQVSGLRYFNVYGPGEYHKGKMASTIFHFYNQSKLSGVIKPFSGSENFYRDFIYIDDIINHIMFLFKNDNISGIFNSGTGNERSFLDVAKIVSDITNSKIEEIEFPKSLQEFYQPFTKAEMSVSHAIGFPQDYKLLEEGIKLYIDHLDK